MSKTANKRYYIVYDDSDVISGPEESLDAAVKMANTYLDEYAGEGLEIWEVSSIRRFKEPSNDELLKNWPEIDL